MDIVNADVLKFFKLDILMSAMKFNLSTKAGQFLSGEDLIISSLFGIPSTYYLLNWSLKGTYALLASVYGKLCAVMKRVCPEQDDEAT